MAEMSFKDKAAAINKTLEGYGKDAIAEHRKGKEGKEKIYTGYKVQYVVDAVNEVIGAENWRWEHPEVEAARNPSGLSSTASVAVMLYIRVGDEWLTKGPVTGDSLNPVEADAMKGALSDGLKKSFAYWSIGNKAYRGKLNDSEPETKPSKPTASRKAESEPKPDSQRDKLTKEIKDTGAQMGLTAIEVKEYQEKYLGGKTTAEAEVAKLEKLLSVLLDVANAKAAEVS